MRNTCVVAAALIVAGGAASSASAAFVIEDFATGDFEMSVRQANPLDFDSQVALGGAIGGARDSTLTWNAGVLRTYATVIDGLLDVASPASGSARLDLEYGKAGDLNMDLTAFGSFFQVDVLFADLDGPKVDIIVKSGATSATVSQALTATDTGYAMIFNFADFGGVDFADVDRITVSFNGNAVNAADFQIDGITVVPTPGAAALLGVAGLVSIRRRR